MIDIKDRICDAVAGKVMSAEAAAEFVQDGDNVGTVVLLRLAIRKLFLWLLLKEAKKLPSKSTFAPAHP